MKLHEALKAHAEGKCVQFKNGSGDWSNCYWDGSLASYLKREFRIKPEPKPMRQEWLVDSDVTVIFTAWGTLEQILNRYPTPKLTKLREFPPEGE